MHPKEHAMARSMPLHELHHELNFARRKMRCHELDDRVTEAFAYWTRRFRMFRDEIARRGRG